MAFTSKKARRSHHTAGGDRGVILKPDVAVSRAESPRLQYVTITFSIWAIKLQYFLIRREVFLFFSRGGITQPFSFYHRRKSAATR